MDNLVDNHADYQDLTVREYAQLINRPEQTIRSRIRAGKLVCVPVVRDGQTQQGVRVKLSDLHADNDDNQDENQAIIRQLSLNNPAIASKLSPVIPMDYQMIIDNNEVRIKELKEQITKLEADNHEKSQKIDDLNQQISDLKEERTGYKKEAEGLQKQLNTLQLAYDEAKERADAEKTRANSFNNQLSNANAKLQRLPDATKMEDMQANMEAALQKHMEAIEERLKLQQKETVIKVEQEQQEPIETPKKGWSFFGFQITRPER